jgi:short-subunit dehydrogenase
MESSRVIWITGASSGIGKALVSEYFHAGYRVIISSRKKSDLDNIAESFDQKERIKVLPMDLGEPHTLEGISQQAWSLFGHIDILVNNAGISQRSLIRETSMEVYRKLMEINYFGNIAIAKALLPNMENQGHGHLVVISSLVGKFGTPYRSGYSASKHALHGFYDSLRAEYHAKNILVTLVCPGFIHTRVSLNALTGDGSRLNEMDDAQANGMPAEIFAKKMKRAVDKGRLEVNIGGRETLGVWIKRIFPGVFARRIPHIKVR